MSTWQTFLTGVQKARADLKLEPEQECFFRGHGNQRWLLLPSLLRHCRHSRIKHPHRIRDLESSLYFEFRARARDLHREPLSDWDVLFNMQHFGTPTRLLDWTETLGVAVYFAIKYASIASVPCVWLLNPYRLNEHSWNVNDPVAPEYLPRGDYDFSDYLVDYSKNEGFDWEEPVALYPVQRNSRLHAQRGHFTIFGEDTRPLEKIRASVVRKVLLPREAMREAVEFLALSGIDEHLLFPDLEGLSRFLRSGVGRSPAWEPTREASRQGYVWGSVLETKTRDSLRRRVPALLRVTWPTIYAIKPIWKRYAMHPRHTRRIDKSVLKPISWLVDDHGCRCLPGPARQEQ